jgi:drug/metabolite transporter (DMT)-like permease
VPFVERVWLGERVPRRLWWPIAVGFLGIVLVLRPGTGLWQAAALVGLMAAVFGAVAQVGIRRLTATEPTLRIIFYFALVASLGSALPLARDWRTPVGAEWFWLVATAVVATGGQLFLTRAYAQAPAVRVGPFIYTSVVFAAALDWLMWGLAPDALTVAGAVVVGAASILALRIEALEFPGPPPTPPAA